MCADRITESRATHRALGVSSAYVASFVYYNNSVCAGILDFRQKLPIAFI
jgi:hypothetical protein